MSFGVSGTSKFERFGSTMYRNGRPLSEIQPSSVTEGSRRQFCSSGDDGCEQFSQQNAYQVLGVDHDCSFLEIKASFRKLAKQTHPDLQSSAESSATRRFLQILAAYEILSDKQRRANYDMYLLAKRQQILHKKSSKVSTMHAYDDHATETFTIEVVEWLKNYRLAIHKILSEDITVGSSYLEQLEGEFYSAIRKAYFGPYIDSLDLPPECFEAEERSTEETAEVLHLVSGRTLFGFIQIAEEVPGLSHPSVEKLTSQQGSSEKIRNNMDLTLCCGSSLHHCLVEDGPLLDKDMNQQLILKSQPFENNESDTYKDLELHIGGDVIATATRDHPYRTPGALQIEEFDDCINVFINVQDHGHGEFSPTSVSGGSTVSKILLGRITGLGTSGHEGLCSVYDSSGTKTHIIIKHRTMCVKHMHWYKVGDHVSSCECRCRRAQLPSSKFWLFEPRCGAHDRGGWYVETFGRDSKGGMVSSKRKWDVDDAHLQNKSERRLHPAMYLMALAYRTLDLEESRKQKLFVRDVVIPKLSNLVNWCKKFV